MLLARNRIIQIQTSIPNLLEDEIFRRENLQKDKKRVAQRLSTLSPLESLSTWKRKKRAISHVEILFARLSGIPDRAQVERLTNSARSGFRAKESRVGATTRTVA